MDEQVKTLVDSLSGKKNVTTKKIKARIHTAKEIGKDANVIEIDVGTECWYDVTEKAKLIFGNVAQSAKVLLCFEGVGSHYSKAIVDNTLKDIENKITQYDSLENRAINFYQETLMIQFTSGATVKIDGEESMGVRAGNDIEYHETVHVLESGN